MWVRESQLSRSLLLVVSCLLPACSGLTQSCMPPPPIDEALTKPCKDPVLAADVGWMQAHKLNAIQAEECRIQYEALIKAVQVTGE